MVISDQEETPASPYIMHFSLNFYDMGIIVNCLIPSFLMFMQTKMIISYQGADISYIVIEGNLI